MNFVVLGVAGFVATRHLEAIKAVGGTIQAAVDPFDSVGRLDSYGLDIRYSRDTDILADTPMDWLSVCTPNHFHLTHCLQGLHFGANVICEKPLVIHPSDLNRLAEKEAQTGRRVYTVLQLRYHPAVVALKESLDPNRRYEVKVNYHTPRGPWYHNSWKGDKNKSGGLAFNIGIHLFDLLIWLFGEPLDHDLSLKTDQALKGSLHLKQAEVTYSLSIAPSCERQRSFEVWDGEQAHLLNLTEGFEGLHTEVYRQALAGNGYGIEDTREAVWLCYQLQ
jgi:UDP-N-acetyl-2-amino-2-deoxyglucuronate dehydrogenase